jgi:predicted nuclease of predicted toxin-antitoxin system
MRFLANENFPIKSIKVLRKYGYDVISVSEDFPSVEDSEVILYAQQKRCVILTFDRDYGELIYHYGFFAFGVVYFRFEPEYPEEPAEQLLKILDLGEIELLNKFTVVERDRIRQRKIGGLTND